MMEAVSLIMDRRSECLQGLRKVNWRADPTGMRWGRNDHQTSGPTFVVPLLLRVAFPSKVRFGQRLFREFLESLTLRNLIQMIYWENNTLSSCNLISFNIQLS